MTSQPARRLWIARETLLNQRIKIYKKIIFDYRDEICAPDMAGKNVRNILRVLNARHKFMKKSQRLKDVSRFKKDSGLRKLLRAINPWLVGSTTATQHLPRII